ncbi:unnamed protein product, partial [Mesorhabditis belari]|uniref:Endonuclease G, mitochondrial n=1 Tax=Mesorhabditis belari TaxID=2138241 RepID=A0AAF3F0H1_9BILA
MEGELVRKNMPWVEKYRPSKLDEVVSHEEIIKTVNNFIASNRIPHMLFYGPPGTGKTSTIHAIARTIYSEKEIRSMILELNASDDRGIDVVRDDIIMFAQARGLHAPSDSSRFKLVILDEADAMTKDAQNALKRVIEKYTKNVRFCIICNYLSSIIPAIQSRCTRFRFAPLSTEQIKPRLEHVIQSEHINITDPGREALLMLCEGDMRRVLNVLQSTTMAFQEVNEDTVYRCVGQPTPAHIEGILRVLLNDTMQNAYKKLQQECVELGFALSDIVTRLHDLVFKLDVPSQVHCLLLTALADTERRLSEGGSDKVQLSGLCAAFVQARHLIGLHADEQKDDMWRRISGVSTIAVGSFLVGTQLGNENTLRIFRTGIAATALQPMPVNLDVPIGSGDKIGSSIAPSRASQIMQYGYPGFDNVRTFEDFVLSYDRKTRTAHWVCEHLSPDRMVYDPSVDRSKCDFRPDTSVHDYFRSKNEDYKGSGYDRGHLAAAGNHRRTQNSVDQTFLLSNMSPQVGRGFNRDKWNDLEKHVRHLAKKATNVYVMTGPLYLPRKETDGNLYVKYKVIGNNHVAVPTHFFKVALVESSPGVFELEAYILPNEPIPNTVPLASFFVPLEMIERGAGFLIFDKLPKASIKKVNGKKPGFW